MLAALLFGACLPANRLPAQTVAGASRIKTDERVVFFPTAARLAGDGRIWIAPIHGWIFEPEMGDTLRAVTLLQFRKTLDLDRGHASSAILDKRARFFLADNERGKRVGIRLGPQTKILDASDRDGHFTGTITISTVIARELSTDGRLSFRAVTRAGDDRRFEGVFHLIEPTGISVISDIDDTIKISEVTDKKKLIENTFLRPFRPVEGMAAKYRQWADSGVQFHFVSSSPWQLYQPLSQFISDTGFPDATFHLKRFRMKDSSFLKLFEDPIQGKLAMILPLLLDYPKRQFILVGDSGERDPEIYAGLARKYPDQILRIYIRDVTDESADSPRYKKTFKDLPADKWQVFKDPQVLTLP